MKNPTFKQWDHLDSADKARRVSIVTAKLEEEINKVKSDPMGTRSVYFSGVNAHAIFCVAARLDGDLDLAQEYLNVAGSYSSANTRYASWIKFRRLIKPYRSILALAHKPNLIDDAKQLLANDLGLDEELQLELIKETNPQLVGDVGANPTATPKVMELVSDYRNVTARARLAENPGLSIELMQKLSKDKEQAQLGLAANWMITEEIRTSLFETLNPSVIQELLRRPDANKTQSMEYVKMAIEKIESSSKPELHYSGSWLKNWLMDQPETPKEIWEPYLTSEVDSLFLAALRKLPIDFPDLERILAENLGKPSRTLGVLMHPGLSDKLVNQVFESETTTHRMRSLLNVHISESSVKKLVDYGQTVVATDMQESLERIQKGWLPESTKLVVHYFYTYLNRGGKHSLDAIRSSLTILESASNLDLNPEKRQNYFTPPKPEVTDDVLERYKHDPLGYQNPEIPAEWLLKNAKNRSDEIKKDVILNPSLPLEAMKILAMDKKPEIRKALALLPNCPDDLRALAALQ